LDISLRLKCIANQIDLCHSVGDIGTDHGYIPIYLIKQGKCKTAIASDINQGSLDKAKFNIAIQNMELVIECRLGAGLNVFKPREVDSIIIAGMGGNLIRDIIEEDLDVFKSMDYAVLQPVQNPEILRKYLLERGFIIIDEDLCKDENKYYEIIKVKFGMNPIKKEEVFYEISEGLMQKNHPLLKEYIDSKIKKYNKIFLNISGETTLSKKRKIELETKILRLRELLVCL